MLNPLVLILLFIFFKKTLSISYWKGNITRCKMNQSKQNKSTYTGDIAVDCTQ